MKKNRLTLEMLIFEVITAVCAAAYIGLQVYYGIVYHAGTIRVTMNVLMLILVYAGFTMLAVYPERVNRLPPNVCIGKVRIYTVRMVELIKLVFMLALLFASICDALGYQAESAYSLLVIGVILLIAAVYEIKIIKILRGRR